MKKTNLTTVSYRLTRNATPTAAKAPYLGLAIPRGSLAYDNVLAKMIDAGTFMSKATATYLLNALYAFIRDEIAENCVRVNLGAVSFHPQIGGSFDSEDDEYREPRNSLYIGATLSQEIRDAVAGILPDAIAGETASGSVKINSVFDCASMTNGMIDGAGDFRICGLDLTVPDGSDESLTLVKPDGVTKVADVVISQTEDGQRLVCHLANGLEDIPAGNYKIRLASHGLDPSAPLTVTTFRVKLIAALSGTASADPADVPQSATSHATLVGLTTSPDDAPDELSIADGLCLVFDKADPEGATGHLVVNGIEQDCPFVVDNTMGMVMWEFGRDELIGERVNFKFRYEDGTEVGNVTKTIREGR